MYAQIAANSEAPSQVSGEPNLDLGLGIKQIRLRMGMTQSSWLETPG